MAENGKFFDLLAPRIAAGETVCSAASAVGCSQSHAYTLSASPDFRRRVSELRTAAISAAVGSLSDTAAIAAATLRELMAAEQDSPVRLNAAKAVLTMLAPLSELNELRGRLEFLEGEVARLESVDTETAN